ncbi:MAG: hypothetical protein IJ906_06365, partial [Oscillospiraceae bacterium]|nr:hypothetical protein [Oscillospiraceae bacterium]
TAVNMWIANEVVLELDQPDAPDVESGKSFYAQMTKKVLSDGAQGVTDGYYFTFDTGDVFFSATANGYPELVGDTLNIGTDNGGGGSSGGVLVVHETDTTPVALDKTWKEIHDAMLSGGAVIVSISGDAVGIVYKVANFDDPTKYEVIAYSENEYYFADSENGYPYIDSVH